MCCNRVIVQYVSVRWATSNVLHFAKLAHVRQALNAVAYTDPKSYSAIFIYLSHMSVRRGQCHSRLTLAQPQSEAAAAVRGLAFAVQWCSRRDVQDSLLQMMQIRRGAMTVSMAPTNTVHYSQQSIPTHNKASLIVQSRQRDS